jgi:Zn-dependent protease
MQETLLPFRCSHCGGQFCSAHRLPENHACPKIDVARAQRQGQVLKPESYNSFNYSYVFGQDAYKRKHRIIFSQKEVKHILVAAALVIGIGVSIALYAFNWAPEVIAIFAVILTASFLIHEIAHKVIAQKSGLWAEFRLTTWGAVLTFVSVFLPFKMISPGAMMIGGSIPSGKDLIKISVAGVITNLAFSITTFGVAFGLLNLPVSGLVLMLFFAAYINSFMAVFNLIPFGILDGYKIFSISKKIWALVFVPSLILTVASYYIVFVWLPSLPFR